MPSVSNSCYFLTVSILLLFCYFLTCADAQISNSSVSPAATPDRCAMKSGCTPDMEGLVIPLWRPLKTGMVDKIARGVVYFLLLCYLFLGVSIVADRFMSAIEMITSQEREITVKRPNGEETVVTVQIWNETVSNLTLMALGSSAPEILLSVVEIIAKKFSAGELGPGTIVGSAAFNLFCIIAICVYVIPDDEVRKIEHLRVFVVTATWSLLAYLWLYFIISVSSVGRVDLWEALLTFAFFPILVALAYITDRKIFFMKFLEKKYTAHHAYNKKGDDIEMQENGPHATSSNHVGSKMTLNDEFDPNATQKREFMKKLHELRLKNPEMTEEKLEQLAAYEVVQNQHKSRAYYRIMATRKMTGAGNALKRKLEEKVLEGQSVAEEVDHTTRIFFDPGEYTVMENVGSFEVEVVRTGEDLDFYSILDFETVDGSAIQGSDFHFAQGSIKFAPGEKVAYVTLHIVDDDEFEEDEHFKLRIFNLRNAKDPNQRSDADEQIQCVLGESGTGETDLECAITILDDDHCGVFSFEAEEITVNENCGEARIKVCRQSGARGNVHVPYMTTSGTAKGGGVDYLDSFGDLEFKNDETFRYITVKIIDDEEYQKSEYFFVEIGHPKKVANIDSNGKVIYEEDFQLDEDKMSDNQVIAMQGRPKLGIVFKCKIHITESQEFKGAVDRLMNNTHMGDLLGTSSWKEQFKEALTVSAGGDDDDEEEGEEGGEEKSPGCMDYVMHFLTVPWKLLFAFIPPTDIMGGWACFVFSIIGIGALTAVIGDLASHFGCTIGLKDTVTAISFVALGTSVPDTFASKTAAVGDHNADASVGNVTGSNAVNVFLGIGLAWSIAAIYHAVKGTPGGFVVEPGTLGFSVTTFCILAVVCIAVLMVRRYYKPIGAELGGPRVYKIITSAFFVGLWACYVILSALVAYCVIEGF